jgi:hypothetical protein
VAVIRANIHEIETHEIIRLVIDFLAGPRPRFVSRCPQKIKGDESERGNVLSPISVYLDSAKYLRALAESAEKLLERFGFR